MRTLSELFSRTTLVGVAGVLASSLIGTTAQAGVVTSSDGTGFSVDWEQVGYPYAATKIAACSTGKLYALNSDKTLWVNNSAGIDSGWQYIDTPSLADSIACDGPTLIAMNLDKTIYREALTSSGAHYGWIYLGSAGAAATLGGGAGVVTALNFDHTVYTSVGNDTTTFPTQTWTYRDTASVAARIAGSLGAHSVGRFFALNTNSSMWYNDGLVLQQPGQWRPYPVGLPSGVTPVEISAGNSSTLFVLDSTHHLWTAKTEGLAVPVVGQSQSNWCWAAAGQMVAEYVGGVELSQCQLANINTGRSDCCTNATSASNVKLCNQGGWWPLTSYGFSETDVWQLSCSSNTSCTSTGNAPLPFLFLQNENIFNRPVPFAWHWTSGGGHAMVELGTKQITVSGSIQNWVTVNNPEPVGRGTQYDQLYTDWESGPGYLHWRDSFLVTKN